MAVDNAVKTGDWEGVGEAASALGGSIAGSAAFAKIATLIFAGMATAGIAVSAPVVIGAVATAAAVGAFAGSELAKAGWYWTKDIRDDLSDTLTDLLEGWLDIPRTGEYHIYDPLTLDLNGNGLIDILGIDGYKGALFVHDNLNIPAINEEERWVA